MAGKTNIDIKSPEGTLLLSVPVNEGAKGYYSLMQHDYIVLPFKLKDPIDFRIGSYADLRGVFDDALGGKLAKMYYVTESQNPTYNTSTGAYEYSLRLNAYYWLWNNFIFRYTPESAAGEASWSLTAPLDVQMGVFLRNLSQLGFNYNGVSYETSIDSTVENKAVAMTYDNMHLVDALFSMGGKNAWDCDVWVTENVIHFGRCEHSDAVRIEIGAEASDMTRNESKGTFATRIYAFGSTRNIPENYRPDTNEDLTVNGVVQKRLMLPSGTPYIDAYPGMKPFEVVESVVVFDDIYPRRTGTLSDVKTVDRSIEGEDGEQTGTFKAYQYRDSGLIFDKEYILEGQELRIVFQSGRLNGLDFGVTFNPEGKNPPEQLWEIVANEDYGRLLPDEVMKPENGDKYILYGFDIRMVSDSYIPEAEQELKERAQKYVDMTKEDDGTYTATLRPSWVRADQIRRTFDVGQRISLVNKGFFGEEGRVSRVIGWEMCLDIPYDHPKYTIGESAQYSRLGDIEDKVDSITFNGQSYKGTGGSGVYVIKSNDSTPPSDTNVFSALRSIATFLRKDKEDTTNFLLNLLGGIVTDFIQSTDFVSGAMGTGFTIKKNADGTTYAEVDRLLVRMKAYFQMLTIMQTEFGGREWVLNAGAQVKCTKVEYIEDVPAYFTEGTAAYFSDGKRAHFPGFYRCYFLSDDGETAVENTFKVGDMARAQDFNIKAGVYEGVSNRFFWRKVIGVGDDYIDLSASDCAEGSDIPKEGDTIVQMGNDRDPDRQNLIVLSAFGEGAPSITFYRGVDSYSLSGKDVFTVGWDGVNGEVRFDCYGRTYIGDRKRESYFEFVPGKGASLVIGGQDVGATLKAMPGGIMSQVNSVVGGLRSEIRQTTDSISLKVEGMGTDISGIKSGLSATGIDIGARTVTLTASQFLVKDSSGKGIAVFKTVDGKPVLKAENIDADSLKVKHLDGADGTFVGLVKASAVYTQVYYVSGESFAIDPEKHGTAFFGCNNYASGDKQTLKMPSVSEWVGINIKASTIIESRMDVGLYLEASGTDRFLGAGSLTENYKYCMPKRGSIVEFISYYPGYGYWIASNPASCEYSNDLTTWYDSEGNQI